MTAMAWPAKYYVGKAGSMRNERMGTKTDNAAWLHEHLSYELQMLQFTFEKIATMSSSPEWNAFFESFAVHARNLYHFLTNESGQGNFNASDFIPGFACKKTSKTKQLYPKQLSQIFHLGKARPNNAPQKITLEDCAQLNTWLDAQFTLFVDRLEPPYSLTWALSPAAQPVPPASTINIEPGNERLA
jgi:hypothetical protein